MLHAAALWTRMTDSWGYFTGEGYGGHLFPVIIGETGTMYHTVSFFNLRREHCILHNYVLPFCTASSLKIEDVRRLIASKTS